jgi:hypothetical protein
MPTSQRQSLLSFSLHSIVELRRAGHARAADLFRAIAATELTADQAATLDLLLELNAEHDRNQRVAVLRPAA